MKMNLMACFVGEASRLPTGAARTPHLRWLLLAILALPVLANTPPEITNVRASQRTDTKLVDIYYDAADADGDLLKVRIEISDNDGAKYSVPAFSLTGDIGEGVAAGKDKHIVWDAGTDWDGEYSDKMRVKVYAIDAQGFPGLEWGNEVPPGGFLMGQYGGAEGSGPSRHVNIPWSYWLSKYEITVGQYCDFLNAALAAGWVSRNGTTSVTLVPGNVPGLNQAYTLLYIGDNMDIRWNVNNFEVVGVRTNHPVNVFFTGAIAFARFYGYDLPTEAEWEKAARGPDNDDQDEHLVYPWGNTISTACAKGYEYTNGGTQPVGYYNGSQTPVGPDTVNGYGLYDVIGNLSEWTRTFSSTIETYPQEECLTDGRHCIKYDMNSYGSSVVVRGGGVDGGNVVTHDSFKLYYRQTKVADQPSDGKRSGFRVGRRSILSVENAKCVGKIDFATGTPGSLITSYSDNFATFKTRYTTSSSNCPVTIQNYVDEDGNTRHVVQIENNELQITFKNFTGTLQYVKFKLSSTSSSSVGAYLSCDGVISAGVLKTNLWYDSMQGAYSFIADPGAANYVLTIYSSNTSYAARVTDIELYTTSK